MRRTLVAIALGTALLVAGCGGSGGESVAFDFSYETDSGTNLSAKIGSDPVTDAAGDESRAKRIASPFSSVFALAAFTLVPTRGSSLLLRDGIAFSFSPASLS